MIKKIFIVFVVLQLILIKSCVERVDIELESSYKRLVVYGVITNEAKHHTVKLSSTTDYFYNAESPAVTGAIITLTFNDSTITFSEKPESSGIYQTNLVMRGIPGTQYKLQINGVDINNDGTDEVYTSVSTMPGFSKADSIQLQKFFTPFFSGYQVILFSPDPPERNWYNYKLFRNGEALNKKLSDYSVQPDEFVNNGYISGFPVGFLDDDDEDEFILPGDSVSLEVNSITEEYFNFIVDAQNEIFGNNPLFSGPPANVSTTIDNDAVGIFTAYSLDRISVIVGIPDIIAN